MLIDGLIGLLKERLPEYQYRNQTGEYVSVHKDDKLVCVVDFYREGDGTEWGYSSISYDARDPNLIDQIVDEINLYDARFIYQIKALRIKC